MLSTTLSACTAAATAALNIAGAIAVKAFDLDTAIIDDIKARLARRPRRSFACEAI